MTDAKGDPVPSTGDVDHNSEPTPEYVTSGENATFVARDEIERLQSRLAEQAANLEALEAERNEHLNEIKRLTRALQEQEQTLMEFLEEQQPQSGSSPESEEDPPPAPSAVEPKPTKARHKDWWRKLRPPFKK